MFLPSWEHPLFRGPIYLDVCGKKRFTIRSLMDTDGVILVAARERDLLDEKERCGDTSGLEGPKHFINLWVLYDTHVKQNPTDESVSPLF